jgi:GH15 family glucan-1,4-alpha-glucosidase
MVDGGGTHVASEMGAPGPAAVGVSRTYVPLADYSLIGDCQTAALVAYDGSIDWLCLPAFDSEAVLCRLLDARKGGYFAITEPDADIAPRRMRQGYIANTAILQTDIGLSTGTLRITDFMPTAHLRGIQSASPSPCIVRRLESLAGECHFAARLKVTPDYARATATEARHSSAVVVSGGAGHVVVACDLDQIGAGTAATISDDALIACRLRPGEVLTLSLSWTNDRAQIADLLAYLAQDWSKELEETRTYWELWSSRTRYHGPYEEAVKRSAITLKLLTFAPTGAIVAAPTTSLPEKVGGSRNWDYRYTWTRDGSFAASALTAVGHVEEAAAFVSWMLDYAWASDPQIHPLYTVYGSRNTPEFELPHLEGYRESAPVRIGNGAVEHLQMDITGELLMCIADIYLPQTAPSPSPRLVEFVSKAADTVCDRWVEADQGIWEVRSAPRHFVYSKVMCWAALNRAIALAERYDWRCEGLSRWRAVEEKIHANVLQNGVDPDTSAFKMAYDSAYALDAALLMLPLVGFLPPGDPRVIATTREIERRLTDTRGFVFRYRGFNDGVGGEEGTFVLLSFWFAENLALLGHYDAATLLFKRLLARASPTALLSEMIDDETGQLLGNFPQAFSHIGLIRTALRLAGGDPTP